MPILNIDRYEFRRKLPLPVAALSFALDQVGVKESPSNWGPKVQEFLAAADIHIPAPWCMAFLNWCGEQAAAIKGVESPLEQLWAQGYCQACYDWAKKNGKLVEPKDVGIGDIFLIYDKNLKRYAHTGFVTEIDLVKQQYGTVEGNTNAQGGREGIEVAKRTRTINTQVVFVRWAD